MTTAIGIPDVATLPSRSVCAYLSSHSGIESCSTTLYAIGLRLSPCFSGKSGEKSLKIRRTRVVFSHQYPDTKAIQDARTLLAYLLVKHGDCCLNSVELLERHLGDPFMLEALRAAGRPYCNVSKLKLIGASSELV